MREPHRIAVVEGVTMRSTAEARWAIFFSQLGLKWTYEPMRFDIGNGVTYTPDFLVSKLGWVEVKPTRGHISESLPRMRKFIDQYLSKESGWRSRLYAFTSCDLPLRVDSVSAFIKDKVYHLSPMQAVATLIAAKTTNPLGLTDNDEFYWTTVENALKAASESKIDHMAPIGDLMRFELDEIVPSKQIGAA